MVEGLLYAMGWGGTSVTLSFDFDERMWECSWVLGSKRYTRRATVAADAVCQAFHDGLNDVGGKLRER